MAAKALPDAETLRQLLDYDPETGVLTWRERPIEGFAKRRIGLTWNTRFAGKVAGQIGSYGYVYVTLFGSRPIGAHRVAWAIENGRWPSVIDHINGDPADNRLANLREVERIDNQRNLKRGIDNTSGQTGVARGKGTKWRAYIHDQGRQVPLGNYETFEEAVAARKAAERRFGYHENHGRE